MLGMYLTLNDKVTGLIMMDVIADCYIAYLDDEIVVLIDMCNEDKPSVTNSAALVITAINDFMLNIDRGGIGLRKVYYRDSDGIFDQILVKNNQYAGFKSCNALQQEFFRGLIAGCES